MNIGSEFLCKQVGWMNINEKSFYVTNVLMYNDDDIPSCPNITCFIIHVYIKPIVFYGILNRGPHGRIMFCT